MGGGLIFHGETVHGHVFEVVSGNFCSEEICCPGCISRSLCKVTSLYV